MNDVDYPAIVRAALANETGHGEMEAEGTTCAVCNEPHGMAAMLLDEIDRLRAEINALRPR